MDRLSKRLLARGWCPPANLSGAGFQARPERVVQFGEGNFLRAFADWMLDVLNEQGLFNGQVVIVQPIRTGLADVLNAQNGLYTLILRGLQHGQARESRRLIGVVSRAINPYQDWPEVVACFCQPEVRFVLSNTTETGIAYVAEHRVPGQTPESFPAKVAALLHARFQALAGDPHKGLIFLPCELIDRNGAQLKAIVLKHAADWKLGEDFCDWVRNCNHFLNTLVDRIVPGYPAAEAAKLATELGYEDRLLDVAESFHLWVIEGPPHLADELPFHKAGLNVVWTDDLTPYRTRKVRILNGAHTASALAAFHAGLNTVQEMMEDDLLGRFVRRAVFEEILPGVPLPAPAKADYAEAVLERFRNPFIRHELLSISLNSVAKWKVRVLPSLLDFLKAHGKLPEVLTFSLAALIQFYRGVDGSAHEQRGSRHGEPYPIRDERDVTSFFEKHWRAFESSHDLPALVGAALANDAFWGADLTVLPRFRDAVTSHLQTILLNGTRPALTAALAKQP